jgi:Peptidase family M28
VVKRRLAFYGSPLLALVGFVLYATVMPGTPHRGPIPELSAEILAIAADLEAHVVMLSHTIGERRVGHGDSLNRARDYIAGIIEKFDDDGRARISFEDLGAEGQGAKNVVFELPGASADVIVVGAHYDSAPGTPGANDNASGVAATLELVRRLSSHRFVKAVRFVLFANEESPYFQSPGMGSLVHARGCRQRGERIDAMLSLESLGYYSDEPGSQRYPWPIDLFYPDRGNFVGFVGNLGSRSLVRRAIARFRESTPLASQGAALPAQIPGVGWSDHWAFWELDYPAIMVTDTAVYRDPHYHQPNDVSANLDFLRLAYATLGLQHVIEQLAVPN